MSVINPKIVFDKKWIRFANAEQIQQNGIDLTLKEASIIVSGGDIDNTTHGTHIMSDIVPDKDDYFNFYPRYIYEVRFNEFVSVPSNACAIVLPRSTLNRNGCLITCGLYDSGFKNYVNGVMCVGVPVRIKRNTRICQIIFLEAKPYKLYLGKYTWKEKK